MRALTLEGRERLVVGYLMLLDHERGSEVGVVKGLGHLVEATVQGWQEVKGRPGDLPGVGYLVDVD